MAAIKPGTRVVRGPDWIYGRQDREEGFVGTVVFVPKTGTGDKRVTVIWDSGKELRYRAGLDGKYDLRVLDTAPAGNFHRNIVCDACGDEDVKGIRWKCTSCDDFDLCSPCYMLDEHDTSHTFVRIDQNLSQAWAVPARNKSRKVLAKGIFPGAEVMRGPDWSWGNDDGGSDQTGFVKQIVTWKQNYYRGGVEVNWTNTSLTNKYRLGAEGCVDICYADYDNVGKGGYYYPEHLPLVDVVNPGVVVIKPSDKVIVNLREQDFRQLQDNSIYGNWNEKMKQCLTETGTIIDIIYDGRTCKVQYEDGETWLVNRSALTRKHTFSEGEIVKIMNKMNCVRDLQEGHGGWNDKMKTALGKEGIIVKIQSDGDMRIKVGKDNWMLSPVCVSHQNNSSMTSTTTTGAKTSTSKKQQIRDNLSEGLARSLISIKRGTRTAKKKIAEAAQENDLDEVKKLLAESPETIDDEVDGRTALQIASYQGYTDVMQALLNKKANINKADNSGDSPLHYAVHGKELQALKMLVKYKANVNLKNKKKQTALHIAVGIGDSHCVAALIESGCNPNLKDDNGDTAMHDAIIQKGCQPEIMNIVLNAKDADFTTTNGDGFNILHWVAYNDEKRPMDLILKRNVNFLNDPMTTEEEFTALHIAAAHDHVGVAAVLISQEKCNINSLDKVKRTPLMISALKRSKRVMELLIKTGCDVNAQDKNGNTALHAMHSERPLAGSEDEKRSSDTEITCLLVESNADIYIKNKAGHSPLELYTDPVTKTFIEKLASNVKNNMVKKTNNGITIPATWVPSKNERFLRVKLSPDQDTIIKEEYEYVKQQFEKSLPQTNIIRIDRVQNAYLWELYCIKRRSMETVYGKGCANELDLFHGTKPDLVQTICDQNFDFRLAGDRVGALYGKGSYFAVEAKYSDGYATADKNRHKFMFLVKVLAGKYTVGNSEYKRPPPVEDNKEKLYDCVVDYVPNPRIYCVFDHNQYYPAYIIEYM